MNKLCAHSCLCVTTLAGDDLTCTNVSSNPECERMRSKPEPLSSSRPCAANHTECTAKAMYSSIQSQVVLDTLKTQRKGGGEGQDYCTVEQKRETSVVEYKSGTVFVPSGLRGVGGWVFGRVRRHLAMTFTPSRAMLRMELNGGACNSPTEPFSPGNFPEAKPTTIKDALKRWEEKHKTNPAEATEVIISFQWPPIEKMDSALGVLIKCETLIVCPPLVGSVTQQYTERNPISNPAHDGVTIPDQLCPLPELRANRS
uniref:Uncharacterized protein n=1 Tax=Timema cristinae TaxID=61476 RepID=A0A7R9H663_TIMCR|nr:unnamed protein product [Timema cristinae]